MYRFINYGKIFEADGMDPSQQTPAPKEVKSVEVDLTEDQIAQLDASIKENSIFSAATNKISFKDGSSAQGMVYIAIKPAGGQQSPENLKKIEELNAAASGGTPILIYEAEIVTTGQSHKLSSILDLAGDNKGAMTSVIFDANPEKTKQVTITFVKADDAAEVATTSTAATTTPAPTQAEIAAETGYSVPAQDITAMAGESVGSNPSGVPKAIMNFDSFVSEAKKEKWIADVKMKKGALKKEMKKEKGEKISAKDIAKSEAKLKKKDKDKKKPGLQLDPKDAKTHKRNVLAKNLMKASGAMNESRQMRIKGAKDQLIKIHEVIEKMIKQTSRKNEKK
jgi:hypothetical protein